MAAVEYTVRRRGRSGSLSCSIQSEHDLMIRDEENFAATQALKKHECELLNLDPERVRVYLDENNLLKVNENKTLRDGTKSKKEKMKYVLNETNCIRGTRGLQHILEMLRSLGGPSYTELANIIVTDYNNGMEEIRRQYPRESQLVNIDRFKIDEKKMPVEKQPSAPVILQEEIVTSELKIIVLGDDGVGKTSLLTRYCTGKFSSTNKRPAISNDFVSKPLERNNHHYELKFWDTHKMEKHSNTIPSVYYRGAVGALLIYDVTTPQSLDSLQQWWKTACSIIMKKDGEPIPAVLLANKSDLGNFDETIELCDELKCCKHFSTSAKQGEGISEAIECLLDDATAKLFSTNYLNAPLFKYGFKRTWEEDKLVLPDPCGELSKIFASSIIEDANNEIIKEGLVEKETDCWTEMPDTSNSVRLDPEENIQNRTICPC